MIRKNILLIVTVLLVLFGCTAEEHTEGARFVKVRGVDLIRPDGTKLFIQGTKDICSDSVAPTVRG